MRTPDLLPSFACRLLIVGLVYCRAHWAYPELLGAINSEATHLDRGRGVVHPRVGVVDRSGKLVLKAPIEVGRIGAALDVGRLMGRRTKGARRQRPRRVCTTPGRSGRARCVHHNQAMHTGARPRRRG